MTSYQEETATQSEINATVFVLDQNELQRRLVSQTMQALPCVTFVGSGAELSLDIEALAPDMLVVQAEMVEADLGAFRGLCAKLAGTRVVLLSNHPSGRMLFEARSLPICGLLRYDGLWNAEFTRSLNVIIFGGSVIDPLATSELLSLIRHVGDVAVNVDEDLRHWLTAREVQVVELMQRGFTNKAIAITLSISLGTVRTHAASIFRKLGVSCRTGAAVSAGKIKAHLPTSRDITAA